MSDFKIDCICRWSKACSMQDIWLSKTWEACCHDRCKFGCLQVFYWLVTTQKPGCHCRPSSSRRHPVGTR